MNMHTNFDPLQSGSAFQFEVEGLQGPLPKDDDSFLDKNFTPLFFEGGICVMANAEVRRSPAENWAWSFLVAALCSSVFIYTFPGLWLVSTTFACLAAGTFLLNKFRRTNIPALLFDNHRGVIAEVRFSHHHDYTVIREFDFNQVKAYVDCRLDNGHRTHYFLTLLYWNPADLRCFRIPFNSRLIYPQCEYTNREDSLKLWNFFCQFMDPKRAPQI